MQSDFKGTAQADESMKRRYTTITAVSTNVPVGFSGFLLDESEALARGSAKLSLPSFATTSTKLKSFTGCADPKMGPACSCAPLAQSEESRARQGVVSERIATICRRKFVFYFRQGWPHQIAQFDGLHNARDSSSCCSSYCADVLIRSLAAFSVVSNLVHHVVLATLWVAGYARFLLYMPRCSRT